MELARWLSNSAIFGARDNIVEGLTEAWCIAEIRCPIIKPRYEDEFNMAEYLGKKAPFSIRKVVCKGPFIVIVCTLWQELRHTYLVPGWTRNF